MQIENEEGKRMPSIKLAATLLAAAAIGVTSASWAAQQESATPAEAVQKANEAAHHLAQAGTAGLSELKGRNSEYVWKDSYVVVQDCKQGVVVAHPITPVLEGRELATLQDENGTRFARQICKQGRQAQGGWVEYRWPRPGQQQPSRKLAYAKAVDGTPYVITAGVYVDDATLEELQQVSARS